MNFRPASPPILALDDAVPAAMATPVASSASAPAPEATPKATPVAIPVASSAAAPAPALAPVPIPAATPAPAPASAFAIALTETYYDNTFLAKLKSIGASGLILPNDIEAAKKLLDRLKKSTITTVT